MADIVLEQGQGVPPTMQTRYLDLGDGTHALVVAALLVGGTGAAPQILLTDEVTGAQVTINTPHHEVHEGETFRAWYVVPHGTPLANDGTIAIVLTTTTRYPHVTFGASGGGDFEFQIFREPTFLADGTPFVPHNLKDSSNIVSTVSVFLNPTITAPGTEIDAEFVGGGTGGNSQGGAIRPGTEDSWRINTSYMVRLTNRAGNAQQFWIEAQWYEEESD